jgi:hypothetical protein
LLVFRLLFLFYLYSPPPINFRIPEPVFMKLVAPEPISSAYFINPSRQSVCLYVYPSYRC